jgi:hypothetical protein
VGFLLDESGADLLDEAGSPLLDEAGILSPVSVAGHWPGTYAVPSGYGTFPPAAPSLQVPVTNTGLGGNWLVAFCSWRTPPGASTTVAVGDDSFNEAPGCNVWEPLGAPAGTSPLSGSVVTSIWYCRNALPAQNVYVSPDGIVTAMAVLVIEMAGLSPWMTLTATGTGYTAASASGPSLPAAAPSGQALVLTAAATDNDSLTVTGPGAGWTALTQVTATDGTDHNADCVLTPAWQVTSSGVTAAWSSSSAQDTAAVIGGLLVSGTAPAAPSQTWPYIQFQAGFGSGAQTPWDQVGWTDLTPRFRSGSSQRGKQYELDAIQAGTVNMMLSNNDGALTPGYGGSPYAPGVSVHTPARLLATWPPPPAQNARTYSVWRGFIERWPQSLSASRYQVSNTTGTDVYALLTTLMQSLPRAEILADGPFAYWPLSDAAGSTSAANLAKGNSRQLQVVASKYGSGGATSAFGISVPYLAGNPSCSGWQQASAPAGGTQGWALYYQDTALPAISGGVTIEGEFALAASQPTGQTLVLIGVRNTSGGALKVQVSSAGILQVSVRDKITGTFTTTNISTATMLTGIPVHVAISFSQTAWTLYVDGGAVRTVSGSCNLANTGYWLSFGGVADRLAAGNFANVTITDLAVYGYRVPAARIGSHWYSAVTAMAGQDTAGPRIDRILGDGNAAFPRVMPPGPDLFTGALDISGQAVSQNVVNAAESDSAWLMVNSAGYLALQDRRAGYNLPVQWTFGELQVNPLNSNPQFLGTVSPWTGGNSATLSFSTAWAWGLGYGSMLITPNGVTAGPFAASELEAVTPGTVYAAAAWVFCPAGWSGAHVSLDWYDVSSVFLSSTAQASTVLNAAVPTELTVSGNAPAGAAYAAVSVHMDGTPPAAIVLNTGFAGFYQPTEFAYLADFATDCDPSQAFNDITLSQLAAPSVSSTALQVSATLGATSLTVLSSAAITAGQVLLLDPGTATGELVTVTAVSGNVLTVTACAYAHAANAAVQVITTAATGVTVTASSASSIAAYGDLTLQQTSYLADPNAIADQGWWIVNTTGTPVNRISQMTLDPSANPALWPVVLGLETGQVMQVNRRLAGSLLILSGQFQVMSVAHSPGPRSWKTSLALLPYPGQVLACDDPQYGQPGQDNCIGW